VKADDSTGTGKKARRRPAEEVAEESRSREVTVAADMVFSMSKNLSGVSALEKPESAR